MNSKFEEVDVAHKRWWQTFEVVFGAPMLAAIVLHFTMPLSLHKGLSKTLLIPVGTAPIILGTIFIILARREFAQYDQPTDPRHPTSKLVTTGVFSVSRNPLYFGGVCFVGGIALVFNLTWMLVFIPAALFACHYLLIAPEERYLSAKFGAEYHTYAASVYRWIGPCSAKRV